MRAPAKLNLSLSVGRLRADGFHDLTTVFQAVGLYDEVTLTRADELSVTVTDAHGASGAADVPLDATNLAVRAVALVAATTGHDARVAVSITKGIPVAGGCAGGSADAAAALVGADALWGAGLSKEELTDLAAQLGSDVPFSLHGGTALGTGRGEQLTEVLERGDYSWVLAVAEGGLSTPAVYAELDRQRDAGPGRRRHLARRRPVGPAPGRRGRPRPRPRQRPAARRARPAPGAASRPRHRPLPRRPGRRRVGVRARRSRSSAATRPTRRRSPPR